MFDFAGCCPITDILPPPDLKLAWRGYESIINFDFLIHQYEEESFRFCTACHNGCEADLIQEEGLFITIYGDCYTRSNFDSAQKGKRINARDVKTFYQSSGLGFLNQLKGKFILIVSDSRKKETFFVADPLNVKSVYYQSTPLGLIFSSSLLALKNLLKELAVPVIYDGASIIEYYLFDFILDDQTTLKGVRELQAGKWLRVRDGQVELQRYSDPFTLFPLTDNPLSEKESGILLSEKLKKNIELFTDGPKKTALSLTGGYDSRSIVALAGADFQDYQYYSYGHPRSWDIKVPKLLARKNHLNHLSIDLSGDFRRDYSKYALQAIWLGDGIAEASRANYLYVYANYLKEKESIITGLFGSELIKNPSTRGAFIDENILSVLRAEHPEKRLNELYDQMLDKGVFRRDFGEEHRDEVMQRVLNNRFVCNSLSLNVKLFYFVLMIGVRKYFAKEIKLERFFINNKTPFFDLDFIEALLLTPFPWVYNWTEKKSLVMNLKIHRIYADFISHNKGLLDTISTHGFKPRYLRSRWFYPALALQFFSTKKKISRESQLSFKQELKFLFLQESQSNEPEFPFNYSQLKEMEEKDFNNYVKLNSLKVWMEFILN